MVQIVREILYNRRNNFLGVIKLYKIPFIKYIFWRGSRSDNFFKCDYLERIMKILVTGGAGFIGSVVVKELISANHSVVVVDNLSKGRKDLLSKESLFYEGDISDKKLLGEIFSKHSFDAVIHLAAAKDAGESMVNLTPYTQNISNLCVLLEVMDSFNCKKIIFSSSAAVYGNPQKEIITEEHPLKPINYYGFSKLECERIASWYSELKGFTCINLRYFNVAGDLLGYVDPNAKNIFPIIGEVISGKRKELEIFGDSYSTPDGTCIRDYIHVKDLAKAHVRCLDLDSSYTFNLGSGTGFSVKELISSFEKAIGRSIPCKIVDKREGDPAKLVCSSKKAFEVLGWKTECSLDDMVDSTIAVYEK